MRHDSNHHSISDFPEPIRVLHVVGILQRGGIETWLLHILHNLDRTHRTQIQSDFLVQTEIPGAYDAAVEALGCRIWKCPIKRTQPWRYARQFKEILREGGPYQIVHSHVHHFSGFTLRLAQQMQVPIRIAHSHNDTSPLSGSDGRLRRLYRTVTQYWIQKYATHGLAASREAAQDLFGDHWTSDRRWQLLYYGVDLTPFTETQDPLVRAELGIPADAFVLGHVGRFEHQKNHRFLLDIAAEVYRQDSRMYLLLIGDGPLRPEIEQLAAQSVFKDRVLFAGLRSDVPRLMQNAMNVFVLPSFFEGLPLVGIEAQAAGLSLVLSDTITSELDAVPENMRRVSLHQPASVWAEAVLGAPNLKDPRSLIATLRASPFNIVESVKQLETVYRKSLGMVPGAGPRFSPRPQL
jgi:glycosyltransferase involved in cell wall biosynthesis